LQPRLLPRDSFGTTSRYLDDLWLCGAEFNLRTHRRVPQVRPN
jgi:hypothetical protein